MATVGEWSSSDFVPGREYDYSPRVYSAETQCCGAKVFILHNRMGMVAQPEMFDSNKTPTAQCPLCGRAISPHLITRLLDVTRVWVADD